MCAGKVNEVEFTSHYLNRHFPVIFTIIISFQIIFDILMELMQAFDLQTLLKSIIF